MRRAGMEGLACRAEASWERRFDLLAVQGTQESFPAPQFESINSLAFSPLYGPTLTSVHDYWKKP